MLIRPRRQNRAAFAGKNRRGFPRIVRQPLARFRSEQRGDVVRIDIRIGGEDRLARDRIDARSGSESSAVKTEARLQV